jgi:hypothetical protein
MNVHECPICMEPIDGENNKVRTECGHLFHCSCLMKNAAHNGFGCPYCRSIMAEIPQEESSDEYEYEEEEDDVYSVRNTYWENEVLTSFRIFHQRLDGEEVEEEEVDREDDEWTMNEYNTGPKPSYEYVSEKLVSQGVTFDDLVQIILCDDHSDIHETYDEFETKSVDIYNQFKNIIIEFGRQSLNSETNLTQDSSSIPVLSLNIPYDVHNNVETSTLTPQAPRTRTISHQEIAEPKVRNIRRYEYIF